MAQDPGSATTQAAPSMLPLTLIGGLSGVAIRLLLALTGASSYLGTRIEVATPANSWTRLQEGYWLAQRQLSPHAGGTFHSSPLLLYFLAPLSQAQFGVAMALADAVSAWALYCLVSAAGKLPVRQNTDGSQKNKGMGSPSGSASTGMSGSATTAAATAALVFLLSPLRIVSSAGATTAPMADLFLLLSLLAGAKGLAPPAVFCWVVATHINPGFISVAAPVCMLLVGRLLARSGGGNAEDASPRDTACEGDASQRVAAHAGGGWMAVVLHFALWAFLSLGFLVVLSSLVLDCSLPVAASHLAEVFVFEYNTADLTPNLGLRWYFFSEVFPDVRDFFSFVFTGCGLLLVTPLSVRLHHNPLLLTFALVSFGNIIASYPSAGSYGLAMALVPAFLQDMTELRASFVVLLGFVYTFTMGPIMFDLWCLKGIGNANFFYAVTLVFAATQGLFLVQCTWAVLSSDHKQKALT